MKPQQLVMLVVAIGCGLAAMVMTQKMLASDSGKKEESTKVPVVVAAVPIMSGARLDEGMLKIAQFEPDNVPEGAIADPAELVGRAAKFQILANEVVTDTKLAAMGIDAGIEAVIEEGKRAITVGISTDRAVAGFIKPGSRVDIMMRVRKSANDKPARVVTILEDVKVIAINSSMQKEGESETQGQRLDMVTFMVSQEEGEALTLAQGEGTLHISLRSSNDREIAGTKGVDMETLLTGGLKSDRQYDEKPETIMAEQPANNGLKDLLAGFMTAPATVEEEPAPVIPEPVVEKKAQKKIVYRDLEGNPLMEIVLDADSRVVEGLGDLAEEVTADNLGTSAPGLKVSGLTQVKP